MFNEISRHPTIQSSWHILLTIIESESHSVVSVSLWPCGLYSPWKSPSQNTGLGSLSLLQGIFPTQESNSGLPHWGQILYQLSHHGSPRILRRVAYLFSSGSSQPRNQTRVFSIPGGFFTSWATREALSLNSFKMYVFIFFWLCWVFDVACWLSLVAASRGYLWFQYVGFSLEWLLLLQSADSRHACLSSCSPWAQSLWHMGLVALQHVDYSKTRDQTCLLHWQADSLALSHEGSLIKLLNVRNWALGKWNNFAEDTCTNGWDQSQSSGLYSVSKYLLVKQFFFKIKVLRGPPWWLRQWRICLQCGRSRFSPRVRQIPWKRKWQPTPVFLPGKSHGQWSLVGYSS